MKCKTDSEGCPFYCFVGIFDRDYYGRGVRLREKKRRFP